MDCKQLEFTGTSEKAAKIYLAALSLGTTSVQELAQKTSIKRPTVYLHVDELIAQGLFEKISINKKHFYRAADPRVLEERLKNGLSAIQKVMPEFEALKARTPGKPQIVVYEGVEGIRNIYREVKKSNSFRVWSNVGEYYAPFHDVYMEVAESVKQNGIGVREIIADTKESRRYSRLVAKMCGPTYVARTATVEGFSNDAIIFGNIVALFRLSEHNMFVVRIEDKTIADSMKALFDMAWKSAKAFR
ncbi:hypothetical protein A3C20_00440 [Candidatus Kaiserbacteria bacterium RIFCSPHIGHO2_02_FULL_55_25]|uniref:Transcription regulator TrmB N-terminal domain-containing protein n=1 Tax=Candidatus Kaiserbacteria bacterium RIFCSPHIGHO2_02_FULL_55_25 TaxID=1798498 RepID=A0A1F6E535_9BACT|nr:MAG: hypothetical protein A2764_02085 [Candidatus Kaiserbacteria bacterium RIFCSPHIGHO2_01_FULL_55_79]OGG68825.1 MAG: hypothetical protein A3C20_00440 [Candidatus Kaiserbacteria bacterium RIFCSPHIGHO2_02_FULL_55_25]OGG77299.1 MAG: hypothetical protein A3F56_04530 [Candidatus Kaiserbacteria bacterium RIFCSPHIGHO2_12_FULL_55_13]OGG84164.1 MAG: hypothetical protein A3A42_01560 [Candidatus Kaiserbacteria bacterium RIFCSPLOWO2_01_FULL_55_25]